MRWKKKNKCASAGLLFELGGKLLNRNRPTHAIIIRGKIYANLLHLQPLPASSTQPFLIISHCFHTGTFERITCTDLNTHTIFIHTWTTWFNRLLLENRCRNLTYNKMANIKLFKKFYLKILLQFVCSTLFIQGKFLIYFQTHS